MGNTYSHEPFGGLGLLFSLTLNPKCLVKVQLLGACVAKLGQLHPRLPTQPARPPALLPLPPTHPPTLLC